MSVLGVFELPFFSTKVGPLKSILNMIREYKQSRREEKRDVILSAPSALEQGVMIRLQHDALA
jgi:hypothetical protein